MDRNAKEVSGAVLFLLGCGVSILTLRQLIFGHIGDIWNFGTLILRASASVYLVYSGLRMVRPGLIKPFRFGWGRVVLGSWILFGALQANYGSTADGPLPFAPSNPAQAGSMKATYIVIGLIGCCLILHGIRNPSASRELPR